METVMSNVGTSSFVAAIVMLLTMLEKSYPQYASIIQQIINALQKMGSGAPVADVKAALK